MTGQALAQAARAAAGCRTLYVKGCFGAPLTEANKARWQKAYAYNRRADRAKKLEQARADTFGFDCVCFIKAPLWGWNGNANRIYGGADYASGGVPDIGEGEMIGCCTGVSDDFSSLEPGEAVWLPGHIGIYVGDGLVAEATPSWADGVQLTACNRDIPGYMRRDWATHGKLPWVTYENTRATGVELPTLRQGSKGEAVRALQLLLAGRGEALPVWGADGAFGSETEKAVRAYQAKNGLAADGLCGPATWSKLLGVQP